MIQIKDERPERDFTYLVENPLNNLTDSLTVHDVDYLTVCTDTATTIYRYDAYAIGRYVDEGPASRTITLDCEKVILRDTSIDIENEIIGTEIDKYDEIIINGIRFIKN